MPDLLANNSRFLELLGGEARGVPQITTQKIPACRIWCVSEEMTGQL